MYRHPEHCTFRRDARVESGAAVAECSLLEAITGVKRAGLCTVGRDACVACCKSFPPDEIHFNPVLATLLYKAASQVLELGGVPGCEAAKAALLQAEAEDLLATRFTPIPSTPACDVVLCCGDSSSETDRAVQSVLKQRGAMVFLHLVDDGGGGAELVSRYQGLSHVVTYKNPERRGIFATLQEFVPRLRSAFVAIQAVGMPSTPDRFKSAVDLLEDCGAEFLAARVDTPSGQVIPEQPSSEYRRYLPWPTLVCRRASLVDMGGFAHRSKDADAELVYRAFVERRRIVLSDEIAVVSGKPWDAGVLGPAPSYQARTGALRHHAIGFPQEAVECDVVLPFWDHLEFVNDSLPSVLEQDNATTVVHLIDDASVAGADELLRYWGTHPRIRIYRNARNLGQFVSFNNVFPYIETELIAIQDADDISLSHRVSLAGNHLRLADADFFGGRFETFEYGEPAEPPNGASGQSVHPFAEKPPYWASVYPRRYERCHFLQNTTAVMRKAAFESLRGFSDYGDVHRNKCGLDTEFFVRAHHAGCRFALTHDVVARYRWHRDSATRNSETGWGTAPRAWSAEENERRFRLFHRGRFDPRALGSLRDFWGLTQRLT
jgi:hypothetical protein